MTPSRGAPQQRSRGLVPSKSMPRTLAPAGTHIARCIRVVDLGTQSHPQYGDSHKVRLTFELQAEQRIQYPDGTKPFVVDTPDLVLSWGRKGKPSNLRKMLESWRGKPYEEEELENVDIRRLINQPCMLTVMHEKDSKSEMRERISSVVPVMPALRSTVKAAENTPVCFAMIPGEPFDEQAFAALPTWLQDKIKKTMEFAEVTGQGGHDQGGYDQGGYDQSQDQGGYDQGGYQDQQQDATPPPQQPPQRQAPPPQQAPQQQMQRPPQQPQQAPQQRPAPGPQPGDTQRYQRPVGGDPNYQQLLKDEVPF